MISGTLEAAIESFGGICVGSQLTIDHQCQVIYLQRNWGDFQDYFIWFLKETCKFTKFIIKTEHIDFKIQGGICFMKNDNGSMMSLNDDKARFDKVYDCLNDAILTLLFHLM